MDFMGKPVKCPCGWNAGGDLRLTTEDFTGRALVTEHAGPDDHRFCPVCDRELDADTVVLVSLFPTTDQDRRVEDLMQDHLSADVTMFTGTRSLGAEFVGEAMCRVYADNGQGAYIIAPDGRVVA